MNSTTQIPFKTSRRLHQHGIIPFDPLDAIDEAVVCENNSQPVFNLTASQRRVLEAWRLWCMWYLNLTFGATWRKGVLKRPSHPRTISIRLAVHERQLLHQVDFDNFREAPSCRLMLLLIWSLLARSSAYVSRCRAFFDSRSSGACSKHCSQGAENSLFHVLRYPSNFVLRDDVHYSEPSPPMFPIAFPEHGAHDAAQEFFQIIHRLPC